MINSFKIPAHDGIDEFVEKRSRFIGYLRHTDTEEAALAFIAEINDKHKSATHNVYAYSIRENNIMRYSDNGEPQGTAGLPVLDVFRHAEICDFCCVVTRYFGGTLLGTGGLCRAYSHAAKIALDAAGVAVMRLWSKASLTVPYAMFETVQKTLVSAGARIENTDYAADVTITYFLAAEDYDSVAERIFDLTSGKAHPQKLSELFMAVPE